MAVVIASDLGKDIAGEPLLRGVSFKLERRDRLTLSGRNGSGKTTLLRMLAGEAEIDVGELVLEKGTRVALHDQRPPRERELSLRDYVLSGCADLVRLEQELARLEQAMAGGASDAAHARRIRHRPGTAGARRRIRLARARAWPWCAASASTTTTSTAGSPPSRAASSRAGRWPARSPATPTCCCSTSPPTTSTSSRSNGSSSSSPRWTPR